MLLLVLMLTAACTAAAQIPDRGQPLRIKTAKLPPAIVGQPYRARLRASGGRPPYYWSLAASILPAGLDLNASTGEISGTPAADLSPSANAEILLQVTDSASPPKSVQRAFDLPLSSPLAITTSLLPPLVLGQPYAAELRATGGTPPLHWRLREGRLPRSLTLDAQGRITGAPLEAGTYHFTVEVRDAHLPERSATRSFTLELRPAVAVRWINGPSLDNGGIFGSLRVTNGTDRDCDLTLIVVAVNQIQKAFTLGYQHFDLPAKTDSPAIPFGFTLPQGTYVVRADAVCEVPATGDIFRSYAQSPSLIQVP